LTAPASLVGEDATPEECAALLWHDLASFALRAFRELNPRTLFAMNWHIELIAAQLAAVRAGRIRRLLVNLPPRHLKSHLASVAFPAWCLGHQPSAQILCVSYAQDLADKLSRDCRRIITSDWYQGLFSTRLSPRHQAVPEFETTAQGSRVATSVGGVLTGRGADIIVIDDPLKPEEALSQIQRQAANEWYDHTLYSRLNDKLAGAIVLIMHRLHEDDLAGHVLAQEPWEVVRLPAIAEDDERHPVETVFGRQSFGRRDGEALHPEREPTDMLDQIRRTIGEYNFAGQYQQMPAPQGGGMIKAAWFRSYAANEQPDRFDRIVQSWDTANKATELADFSVCTTWGIKGKDLFLLHVRRKRMEYPELKRAVCEQCEAFGATVVLIEDKASGTQLIQELVHEGLHAVTRYQPQVDKIMRMHAQTAMIENGFVHLPKDAAWLPEYLHELTVFPKGKHDDQVDSTAQMLDWLKQSGREPGGFFQLVKERAEALRRDQAGSGPPVRLRAPPGISAVQLLSGARRTVAADRTVEMSESDAAPLQRAGWVRVEAHD
jgi:predicted phage terminase large subunit-like protein